MITRFEKVFKPIGLKKPVFRNLLLTVIAISVAKTFRINEIASRLPISVKKEKSKQKRLLRFLDTPLPIDTLRARWFETTLAHFGSNATEHLYLLIDETDLIAEWKALVVSIPFRNRAIPVFGFIYSHQQIQALIYKSHNEIIQYFCEFVDQVALRTAPKNSQRPVLVFDRGFARGKYVIEFLNQRQIRFVMRACKHVGIYHRGSFKKLDEIAEGWHPDILYHKHLQIPLHLYIVRDGTFKAPMYLISNHVNGHQRYQCYTHRMQIEHGFRDIKACFGFGNLVLKKTTQARLEGLGLCACLAYGLLFLCYEKTSTHWAKAYHTGTPKSYSVITIIKKVLTDLWNKPFLIAFFTDIQRRGDPF